MNTNTIIQEHETEVQGCKDFDLLIELKRGAAKLPGFIFSELQPSKFIQPSETNPPIAAAADASLQADRIDAAGRATSEFNDPEFVGRSGVLVGKLASRNDANTRLVTAQVRQLERASVLPPDHGLVQGDVLVTSINGVPTMFKLNRANGTTVAAHVSDALTLPACVDGKFEKVNYPVVVLGRLRSARAVVETDADDEPAVAE